MQGAASTIPVAASLFRSVANTGRELRPSRRAGDSGFEQWRFWSTLQGSKCSGDSRRLRSAAGRPRVEFDRERLGSPIDSWRTDTLVFSGGIGQNPAAVRARICEALGLLGIELDASRSRLGQVVSFRLRGAGSSNTHRKSHTGAPMAMVPVRSSRPPHCSASGKSSWQNVW